MGRARTWIWDMGLMVGIAPVGVAEFFYLRGWPATHVAAMLAGVALASLVLWGGGDRLATATPRTYFAVVALLFAATRLVWLYAVPTKPTSDFYYYYEFACGLSRGDGIPNSTLSYFHNWWAYPLFLSVWFHWFGCSLRVAHTITFLLGAGAATFMFLIARECAGPRAARLAVLLFALWPAHIMFGSVVATEHLALALVLSGGFFGSRLLNGHGRDWLNAVLAAGLLGAGTIVRPATVAYLAVLCAACLFGRSSWTRRAFMLVLVASVCLAAEAGYTYVFQTFKRGVSPTIGYSMAANLLYGSNYEAAGQWNADDFARIRTWPRDRAMALALAESERRVRTHTWHDTLSLLAAKNQEFWAEPRFAYTFSTTELLGPAKGTWLVGPTARTVAYAFQLFLVVGSVASAIAARRRPLTPAMEALPWALVLGTTLHLVFVVSSRYSHVFTPILIIMTAALAKRRTTTEPFSR